jgi:LysM repeat protein
VKIHFVKAGETLTSIAEKHGVTVGELLEANPIIADPDDLKVAMKLVIPDKKAGNTDGAAKAECPPGETGSVPDKAKTAPSSETLPAAKPESPQKFAAAGGTAEGMQTDANKGGAKWPTVPVLPDMPGLKPKSEPCQSCQSKTPGSSAMPLPYAQPQAMTGAGASGTDAQMPWGMFQWTGTGTGLSGTPGMHPSGQMPDGAFQHPFAAIPQPAWPVQGVPGDIPQSGQTTGSFGSGQWGVAPVGGYWGGGVPGTGPHGGGAWGGSQQVAGAWGPAAYGTPWGGMPGTGQPGYWAGYHAPYNTPFTVNPFDYKPDRPETLVTESGSSWQPYRQPGKDSPAFLPPHAAVTAAEDANEARLHQAPDTDETEKDAAPAAVPARKKPPAKKRRQNAELTLKEKIIRMQKNHRRY